MVKRIEDLNYYELLEVSPKASAQDIHKAYERIRRVYDPNSIALYSLFTPEETAKIRQRIEEAYRTLIYEENRSRYDRLLWERQPHAEPDMSQLLPRQPLRQQPVKHEERAPFAVNAPAQPAAEPNPQQENAQSLPSSITEFTGSVLKVLREQRGLSIRNVADITKVGSRYLEYIEQENFPKLPARPYLRGFLALYAKALGYEPERIVNDYMKRYDAAMSQPKK